MDKTDKIWLSGSVAISFIASLVIAILVHKSWISCEIAVAGGSIKICEMVFGENSSTTVFWINCADNFLESYNHSPASEKALGEFVVPSLLDALQRCLRNQPVSENDFLLTTNNLLGADGRFSSPTLYDDMELVRGSIVTHWGKDSAHLIYTYWQGLDILNALSARNAGKENDQNIEYSTALAFEACRLGKLHKDEPVTVWTSCQRLVQIGEYYFIHEQYDKAADFYGKVLTCVPGSIDSEGHLKKLVEERISTAKAKQSGKMLKVATRK